jgi:hypothetical protein
MKCKSPRRYVSRLSSFVLDTNEVCLSARIREKDLAGAAKTQLGLAHRTVRWCTGHCPMVQASSGELATLGKTSAAYDYNSSDCPVVHRTVR